MLQFLGLLFTDSVAKGEIFPRYYYRSEEVQTFTETGTFQNFVAIPDDLKFLALLDLYYARERAKWPPKESSYVESPEKERIFAHYLVFLSAEDRARLDELAFMLAASDGSPATVQYFYEVGTKAAPLLKKQYLCSVLENMGTFRGDFFDPELFSKKSVTMGTLLPLIASNNFLNLECDFNTGDSDVQNKGKYSVSKLLTLFDAEEQAAHQKILANFYQSKRILGRVQNNLVSKSVDTPQPTAVACSQQELLFYLKDAFRILNPYPAPVAQLLSVNQQNCKIHFLLTKRKENYQLILNIGLPSPFKNILIEKSPEGFVNLLLQIH